MSDIESNIPTVGNGNQNVNPSTNNVQKLWENIKHFKPSEFDDPTEPGSGIKMNIEFIKILDGIRDDCGFSLHVSSGYRNPSHNADVGGKQDSAHTEGVALDTGCLDGTSRYAILSSAIKRGIKRIGIGETFIHLDMSYKLPQSVLWLYPTKAIPENQRG